MQTPSANADTLKIIMNADCVAHSSCFAHPDPHRSKPGLTKSQLVGEAGRPSVPAEACFTGEWTCQRDNNLIVPLHLQ